MNELHEISQAIGALQEGQRSAETSRKEHSDRIERQFDLVAEQLQKMSTEIGKISETIDSKVEKATSKVLYGSIGGTFGGFLAFAGQWTATHFGIKFS